MIPLFSKLKKESKIEILKKVASGKLKVDVLQLPSVIAVYPDPDNDPERNRICIDNGVRYNVQELETIQQQLHLLIFYCDNKEQAEKIYLLNNETK